MAQSVQAISHALRQHRKFMMSIRLEIYNALLEETDLRGYQAIQETIREMLSEWYRNRKKEEKERLFPHLRA